MRERVSARKASRKRLASSATAGDRRQSVTRRGDGGRGADAAGRHPRAAGSRARRVYGRGAVAPAAGRHHRLAVITARVTGAGELWLRARVMVSRDSRSNRSPVRRPLWIRIRAFAVAGGVDPRRSAGRLGVRNSRPLGRDVPHLVRGPSGVLPRPPCPALRRRSFWLEPASARRALARPSRPGSSSDGSAIAATSSRCSPTPSVRSRRPSGAGA